MVSRPSHGLVWCGGIVLLALMLADFPSILREHASAWLPVVVHCFFVITEPSASAYGLTRFAPDGSAANLIIPKA